MPQRCRVCNGYVYVNSKGERSVDPNDNNKSVPEKVLNNVRNFVKLDAGASPMERLKTIIEQEDTYSEERIIIPTIGSPIN